MYSVSIVLIPLGWIRIDINLIIIIFLPSLDFRCQPGTFSAGGSAATCTPCAAGSFSTSTTAAQCTLCPASTYNDKTGSSTSSSCVACPTGSVSKIGSASFAACATG